MICDFPSVRPEDQQLLTPRHLLHEYLNVAVFRNRAQVLNDIAVLEVLMQGYFIMKRLGLPSRKNKASVTCQIPGAQGSHCITSTCPTAGHHFFLETFSSLGSHEPNQLPICKLGVIIPATQGFRGPKWVKFLTLIGVPAVWQVLIKWLLLLLSLVCQGLNSLTIFDFSHQPT